MELETINEPRLTEAQASAVEQAAEQAGAIALAAQGLVIRTDEDYMAADAAFNRARKMKKAIEEDRRKLTGPLKEVVKLIEAKYAAPLDQVTKAEAAIRTTMEDYQRRKRAEQREAEARAAEEKRRQEEEARQAAQAKLDEAAKLKAQAEESAAAAQQLAAEDPLAAALLAEDAKEVELEAQRKRDEGFAVIRESAAAPAVVVPGKLIGAGSRTVYPWKHRVTDPSLVPDEYWVLDESKLAALARSLKDKAQVPGVEFYEDVRVGGR